MVEYITVMEEGSDFFIEKKSKFIGSCAPVQSQEQAQEFIGRIKEKYSDASHNVSAYILRRDNTMRFFDDGEPQGKAGIPLLETMKKSGITDAVIVATRYFGGELLGGGGLIRAYSHTGTIAIAASGRCCMKECCLVHIKCDYSFYGRAEIFLADHNITADKTEFLEDITIYFHVLPGALNILSEEIANISAGKVKIETDGKEYFKFLL